MPLSRIYTRLTLSLCIGFFSLGCFAQFNLEAGYSYAYQGSMSLQSIIHKYETLNYQTNDLSDAMSMHGIDISGIFHWNDWSAGAYWTYRRNRNSAKYWSMDGQSELEERLTYMDQTIGLAAQANFGPLAIGNRTGLNSYRLKFSGNTEEPERNIKLPAGINTQVYISYTLPGQGLVRFLIRPYIQLNLYEFQLDEVQIALDMPVDELSFENYRQGMIGISLIFANGEPRVD